MSRWTAIGEQCGQLRADSSVTVSFPGDVYAVPEGQVVGLWDGDMCLGSGVISGTRTSDEE